MNTYNWGPKLATCSVVLWETKQQSLSYTAKSPCVRDKPMYYIWCQETKTSCMYPECHQWFIDYICVPEQELKGTQEVVGELLTKSQIITTYEYEIILFGSSTA